MHGSNGVVNVVEVDDAVDVRIGGEWRTGREKTVRVVIDVASLPEMFEVARVFRSRAHEEVSVRVGGPVAEKLLEYVELLLVFEKAVECIVAGWKLRTGSVHCVSVEQIWDNDVPVAMKFLQLLLV